jgi:hypothetical protein
MSNESPLTPYKDNSYPTTLPSILLMRQPVGVIPLLLLMVAYTTVWSASYLLILWIWKPVWRRASTDRHPS